MEGFPPIVALVGPTAVGKSALALALARRFPFDIVTADSRQVYRYMDIGTAKPSPAERAEVRHYLLDLVEPDESYSAQQYALEATRVLRRIAAQARLALVTGGTGFYLRALLERPGLPAVPPDPAIRARLAAQAEQLGPAALHARLAGLDPASAGRIHPRNLPRVIRALEVVETLGGPVPPAQSHPLPALYLGLDRPRGQLREIADRRVLAQIRAGLVEETGLLLAMGYSPQAPALQGFGYAQMVAYLEGRTALPEAIRLYQQATHQYIRRQFTWFRHLPSVRWIEAGPEAEAQAVRVIEDWLSTASCS